MEGLNRDFVSTSLSESVYHASVSTTVAGLAELRQVAISYEMGERGHADDKKKLELDTVVTRLDDCAHVEGNNTVYLDVALTASELSTLQHLAYDVGNAEMLDFISTICRDAVKIESAYKIDINIPSETRTDLEEDWSDIARRLASSVSMEILDDAAGNPAVKYKLFTYLTDTEFQELCERAVDSTTKCDDYVGRFCAVICEEVVTRFDAKTEQAEFADFVDPLSP